MDYSQESNENEDSRLKRRIIINDDCQLQLLLKLVTKWVLTDYENSNDSFRAYNQILEILSKIVASRKKSQLIHKRNLRDLEKYKDIKSSLDEKITDIKQTIEMSKALLLKAKKEHKRKVIYNILAKELDEIPSKHNLTESIESLKMEFDILRNKFDQINKDQSSWKTNFKKFHKATDELTQKIEELKAENKSVFKPFKKK